MSKFNEKPSWVEISEGMVEFSKMQHDADEKINQYLDVFEQCIAKGDIKRAQKIGISISQSILKLADGHIQNLYPFLKELPTQIDIWNSSAGKEPNFKLGMDQLLKSLYKIRTNMLRQMTELGHLQSSKQPALRKASLAFIKSGLKCDQALQNILDKLESKY